MASAIRDLLWSCRPKLNSTIWRSRLESYNAHPQDYALNLPRLAPLSDRRLPQLVEVLLRGYKRSRRKPRKRDSAICSPCWPKNATRTPKHYAADRRRRSCNYYANVRLAVAKRWLAKYGEADAVLQRLQVAYPADVVVLSELGLTACAEEEGRGQGVVQRRSRADPGVPRPPSNSRVSERRLLNHS